MICWFENHSNNIGENTQNVFLVSNTSSLKNGLPILPLNFKESVALYVVRRTTICSFHNREDAYLAPNKDTLKCFVG